MPTNANFQHYDKTILALDCSADISSVALLHEGQVYTLVEDQQKKPSAYLLAMMDQIFTEAGINKDELHCLTCTIGPGSFTGVRIAISIIQGLSYSLDIPVVPISSLAAMALGAQQQQGASNVLVAIDARMSELYWAYYHVPTIDECQLIGAEHVSKPEAVITDLAEYDWAIGNGWQVCGDKLTNRISTKQIDPDSTIHANFLLPVAAKRSYVNSVIQAEQLLPNYLRNQVVQT